MKELSARQPAVRGLLCRILLWQCQPNDSCDGSRVVQSHREAQVRWIGKGHIKHRNWESIDRVDADRFGKNVRVLCDYLEPVK